MRWNCCKMMTIYWLPKTRKQFAWCNCLTPFRPSIVGHLKNEWTTTTVYNERWKYHWWSSVIILGLSLLTHIKFCFKFSVRSQRQSNVHTTSSQRCGRCIDVKTTLCAYREEEPAKLKRCWSIDSHHIRACIMNEKRKDRKDWASKTETFWLENGLCIVDRKRHFRLSRTEQNRCYESTFIKKYFSYYSL